MKRYHHMPTDGPLPGRGERVVLQTIADAGPISIAELADRLAAHPITIERRCQELQRAGYVHRCAGGTFAVDDATDPARAAGD